MPEGSAAPPAAPTAPASAPSPAAPPASAPSQMDQAFARMNDFTEPEDGEVPIKPPTKAPPAKAPSKKAAQPPKQEVKSPEEQAELEERARQEQEEQPKPGEKPQPDKEKGARIKPWDLVDRYKGEASAAKRELAEIKAKTNGHEVPKEAMDKISTLESRNKELEEEIRFTKYEKSNEYQEQFHKPYLEAWQKAVAEFGELTVTDENGRVRQGNASDLLTLAQMPLGQARKHANELFGDAADDIMAHRRVVRELAEKQHKALDDARKNGGEREKQAALEHETRNRATSERMAKDWHNINSEAQAKYDWLRPADGQEERNAALEKAEKFVDESFGLNLAQAKTETERQDIMRRHSALRNRAIGFSVLKHENTSLKAELAELKKSLEEFQGSEPTAGEQGHDKASSGVTDPMDAVMRGIAGMGE